MRALRLPNLLTALLLLSVLSVPALAQRIDTLTVRPSRTLGPGDVLHVIMTGTSGGHAEFEVLGTNIRQSMSDSGGGVYEGKFTIPRGMSFSNKVVFATLTRGGTVTKTASDRVTVSSTGGGAAPPPPRPPRSTSRNVTFSPGSGASVTNLKPEIGAHFNSAGSNWGQQTDRNSIVFHVDGRDVTRQMDVFNNAVVWTPSSNLTPGRHSVDMEVRDNNGNLFVNKVWSFTVKSNQPRSVLKSMTLAPTRGTTTSSRRPRISATTKSGKLDFDENRIHFTVDGRDVSRDAVFANRVGNYILWDPNRDLSPGRHKIEIALRDRNGNFIVDEAWSFNVKASSSSPPPRTGSSKITLMPKNGARTTYQYPTIGIKFAGNVDQRSRVNARRIRFKVDGTNVSNDVVLKRNEISYRSKKLSLGRHTVDVLAYDNSGKKIIDEGWNFTVTSKKTPPVTQKPGHKLAATNMSNGLVLGNNFVVNGTGIPGTRVVVTGEYPKQDILSVLGGVMLRYQGSATVASNGTFSVPLDATGVRKGEPMTLTITDSVNSPKVVFKTEKGHGNQAQPNPGSSGGNTPPPSNTRSTPITFTVFPSDGNVSGNRTPRIGSKFNQRVSRVKLIVDGRDFTNKARFNGNEVFWDAYQLDTSRHSATVIAWVNGREQRRSWSFEISSKPAVTPGSGITVTPFPRDGLNTPNRQPRIGATFSSKVSSAKLIVDGRDFTNQATFNGNEVYWDPGYDLDKSRHTVNVTVWLSNGTQQTKSWSFRIQ